MNLASHIIERASIPLMEILTGEIILLVNMAVIYWSVRSSSRMGGDTVKGWKGCIFILTRAASITLSE